MNHLVNQSYAPKTLLRYTRLWKNFKSFLLIRNISSVLPVKSDHIALYLGHLTSTGLKATTIRTHLSAIAWNHKILGYDDPTRSFLLRRVMIGIGRGATSPTNRVRPVTWPVLTLLVGIIPQVVNSSYEHLLFKCCFLLAYHAALRASELCHSGSIKHAIKLENVTLCFGDEITARIKLESHKHSKASAFFILSPSDQDFLCPVKALREYLKVRPRVPGILFVTQSGAVLRREVLAKILKCCANVGGLDGKQCNTHSFRAGRATDLAVAGTPEAIIKETGRWASNAFTDYIRFPLFRLPEAGGV